MSRGGSPLAPRESSSSSGCACVHFAVHKGRVHLIGRSSKRSYFFRACFSLSTHRQRIILAPGSSAALREESPALCRSRAPSEPTVTLPVSPLSLLLVSGPVWGLRNTYVERVGGVSNGCIHGASRPDLSRSILQESPKLSLHLPHDVTMGDGKEDGPIDCDAEADSDLEVEPERLQYKVHCSSFFLTESRNMRRIVGPRSRVGRQAEGLPRYVSLLLLQTPNNFFHEVPKVRRFKQ